MKTCQRLASVLASVLLLIVIGLLPTESGAEGPVTLDIFPLEQSVGHPVTVWVSCSDYLQAKFIWDDGSRRAWMFPGTDDHVYKERGVFNITGWTRDDKNGNGFENDKWLGHDSRKVYIYSSQFVESAPNNGFSISRTNYLPHLVVPNGGTNTAKLEIRNSWQYPSGRPYPNGYYRLRSIDLPVCEVTPPYALTSSQTITATGKEVGNTMIFSTVSPASSYDTVLVAMVRDEIPMVVDVYFVNNVGSGSAGSFSRIGERWSESEWNNYQVKLNEIYENQTNVHFTVDVHHDTIVMTPDLGDAVDYGLSEFGPIVAKTTTPTSSFRHLKIFFVWQISVPGTPNAVGVRWEGHDIAFIQKNIGSWDINNVMAHEIGHMLIGDGGGIYPGGGVHWTDPLDSDKLMYPTNGGGTEIICNEVDSINPL